ncbi:MAG: hypothetical protein ACYTXI_20440 [Nostoc sp.]
MTHESLQRSLSISTANFVYIVGLNPADDQKPIKLSALINSITNCSKALQLLLYSVESFAPQSSTALVNRCYLDYQLI